LGDRHFEYATVLLGQGRYDLAEDKPRLALAVQGFMVGCFLSGLLANCLMMQTPRR
jgi:hypothetical protein